VPKDSKKAIGIGLLGVAIGGIYLATKAKAVPPPKEVMPPPESGPGLGNIYGVVTDHNHNPIGNVDIYADEWHTTTDDEGLYEFINLPSHRSYLLTFSKEGYQGQFEEIWLESRDNYRLDVAMPIEEIPPITPPEGEGLEVTWSRGTIEILGINGAPLKNPGSYEVLDDGRLGRDGFCIVLPNTKPVTGISYHTLIGAELETPIVVDHPIGMEVEIKFRNVNVNVQPGVYGGTKALGFEPRLVGTSMAEQIVLYDCRYDTMGYQHCYEGFCGRGINFREGHSSASAGSTSVVVCKAELYGHYCEGLYDMVIKVGTVPWDMPWIYGPSAGFVIKDAVHVLSDGYRDLRTW